MSGEAPVRDEGDGSVDGDTRRPGAVLSEAERAAAGAGASDDTTEPDGRPLRDLLGFTLWLGSYGGENFYYRGKVYKLKEGGRVESPD